MKIDKAFCDCVYGYLARQAHHGKHAVGVAQVLSLLSEAGVRAPDAFRTDDSRDWFRMTWEAQFDSQGWPERTLTMLVGNERASINCQQRSTLGGHEQDAVKVNGMALDSTVQIAALLIADMDAKAREKAKKDKAFAASARRGE